MTVGWQRAFRKEDPANRGRPTRTSGQPLSKPAGIGANHTFWQNGDPPDTGRCPGPNGVHPLEQTSSEKAPVIRERYENTILADRTHCLGSFVFYWSEKQETTHTWYGLFCGGLRTESIDVMQRLSSGTWPENRAPAIKSLGIEGFTDPRTCVPADRAERIARASMPPTPTRIL